jgi:hypothetical protein
MLLKNKKPFAKQGRRIASRYHPACQGFSQKAGIPWPLKIAITGIPVSG